MSSKGLGPLHRIKQGALGRGLAGRAVWGAAAARGGRPIDLLEGTHAPAATHWCRRWHARAVLRRLAR